MLVNLGNAELSQELEPKRAFAFMRYASPPADTKTPAQYQVLTPLPEARRPNAVMDGLNFSIAGMRDGVGPLLTLFLVRNAHLSPSNIATALAAPSFACLLAQIPTGVLYDRIEDKRKLVIFGALMMALGGLLMSRSHELFSIVIFQIVCGISMCMISVGIPALSFASVGDNGLAKRLARNEIFSKFGNFSAIALTGFLAQAFGLYWIFYAVAASALIAAAITTRLPKLAPQRALANTERLAIRERIWQALRTPGFVGLVAMSFVFQFANASMFMIFEQSYARAHTNGASVISTAVFLTQAVIMAGTLLIASRCNRTPTLRFFQIGFLLIAARGLIFALDFNLASLAVGQLLDGSIAAIIIIVPIRQLGKLARGNFNVLTSVLGTCVSLGAALSTLCAGFMIKHLGETLSYGTFAIAAILALIVFSAYGFLTEEQSSQYRPFESNRARLPVRPTLLET